jgi:hypothetical protein
MGPKPEPRVLHVRRRGLDIAAYNARHAQEGEYSSLITEPTLLYDEDEQAVTLAYLTLEQDTTALVGGAPSARHSPAHADRWYAQLLSHVRVSPTQRPAQ